VAGFGTSVVVTPMTSDSMTVVPDMATSPSSVMSTTTSVS
jgi:hypothetical protein